MAEIGKQQSRRLNITVSSGSGTGTITNAWDVARWIRVIPPSESTTYTLTLKDADGYLILTRTSQLGTFSERVEISLGIISTVNITSASGDGTYIFKADMH